MSFNERDVKGLVRNEVKKGDSNRDKPYTALLTNGERVKLSASEAKSLERRLDKDRSRMERDGSRAKERQPEPKPNFQFASDSAKQNFLKNFDRKG